jgi:Bacterial Ig-like domain (group 3)/FG-GAP-like repeat
VTTEPPAPTTAGTPFNLIVAAENNLNQVDTAFSGAVSLTLVASNGATLGGFSMPIAVVNGVASFNGLSINKVGSGYTIFTSSGALTSATTTSISVTNASAFAFILTPPVSGTAIAGIPFPLTVTAVDSFGNTVTNYVGTVLFTSADPDANLPVDQTFSMSNNGSRQFQVTLVTPGSQSVVATDTGNSTVTASSTVQVNQPTATTSTLMVSPSGSSIFGQAVTLSAAVSPNPGTGSVTFFDGMTALKTVALTATGATLVIPNLTVGAHSFRVGYSGSTDGTFAGSNSSSTPFQVNPANTSTTLTSSASTTSQGHAVMLSATIKAVAPGSGVPTGVVQFFGNGMLIGSASLNTSGVAVLPFSSKVRGTYAITATYTGVTNYSSSNAVATQVKVVAAAQGDFDGDGKSDIAIFDQTSATFYIQYSGSGVLHVQPFGNPSDKNIAVMGDFDGDGKTDIAIYDQTLAEFFILKSATGLGIAQPFGNPTHVNIPVAGDFDGDGKTDIAIYDQTTAEFLDLESSGVGAITQPYGNPADLNIPLVGDYDGDGKTDIAIFDATLSVFFIDDSDEGSPIVPFGNNKHANRPV